MTTKKNSTDEETVRRELAGNLCRCTGYRAILDAVTELEQDGAAG